MACTPDSDHFRTICDPGILLYSTSQRGSRPAIFQRQVEPPVSDRNGSVSTRWIFSPSIRLVPSGSTLRIPDLSSTVHRSALSSSMPAAPMASEAEKDSHPSAEAEAIPWMENPYARSKGFHWSNSIQNSRGLARCSIVDAREPHSNTVTWPQG